MRVLLIFAPLTIAALVAVVTAGETAEPEQPEAVAEPQAISAKAEPSAVGAVTEKKSEDETAAVAVQTETPPTPRSSAVAALRQGMEAGDPRMPPLAPRAEEREMPSAEELADPDLYRAYEARQKQEIYASFAAAASKKISALEEMIALGGRGGVTAEQLQEAKNKVEKLREQRELLLQQHPELQEHQ
ncbi:hypothetical protein [Microbulbifer taiwanensis]|uniref:Uncharacterized protein n=1 Tax=Microbulbifer taiwanensis TaxID=986746 RepID=A0ABW1YSU2_9GAMM|nr:hypothetical protein [Microbulbifer taiwanensis]